MAEGKRAYVVGAALMVVAMILALSVVVGGRAAHAFPTTFTVTNTNDSGAGSLRQAILDANANVGADTINFNIPGTGVKTITPTAANGELPNITEAVTINGYTQGDAHPNTLAVGNNAVLQIELSGASVPGGVGLRIGAANTTVKGLVINRWASGVRMGGNDATGNQVTGNYIGTNASGTQDLGNSNGVSIVDAPNTTVGGTTRGARNIISGNSIGVDIQGADATGNKVMGNYIGTNASGTQGLGVGASGDGVRISASNNTIGGTTAGARNVISGNTSDGVVIAGNSARGNKVMGNYIGTNASGTQDLGGSGDGDNGVTIVNAPNNTIGGNTAGERNVISGNDGDGVQINGNGARGNKVMGNYLGTDKNGTADLGNGFYGVLIIEAPNNYIGGTQAGQRNVISGNGDDGVEIDGDSATGNRVLTNSIFNNDELGIDLLGTNGPTANDPGDGDTGPNTLQNKPVISSARTSTTSTTVRGRLNSTPNKTFRIQFFSNPSGNEGKTFIGQRFVTTDGSGNVSFTFKLAQKVGVGRTVTATATGPGGNTSEFSAPRAVVRQ